MHPLLVPARYIALQLSIARYIATGNYCIALSQPLSQATAVNFSTNLVWFCSLLSQVTTIRLICRIELNILSRVQYRQMCMKWRQLPGSL